MKKVALAILLASSLFAKITVTTTIFPIYDIAKNIAGDRASVSSIIPFGVEPHDFDPKAKDMAVLSKSDIFLSSGEVFEPWSVKMVKSLKIESKTIDTSRFVKLIKPKTPSGHGHEHSHAQYDPHYWLSIDNQILVAKEITALFSKKDPQNAKAYSVNGAEYIKKLQLLKAEYEVLKTCKNKKLIVNHDAFGYLTNDYGITQYSISGMSPESAPSAKQMAKLVGIVKKEKINVVFFEEFASDKVAKTIAKEARIRTDALRPVENITMEESQKNIGYIDIMRQNLVKLKGAMDCQ